MIDIKNLYKIKPTSKNTTHANIIDPNLPQQYRDQVMYVRVIFDRDFDAIKYVRVDHFIFQNTLPLYMYMVFLYNLSEEDLVHLALLGIELVTESRELFKALVNESEVSMRGFFLG